MCNNMIKDHLIHSDRIDSKGYFSWGKLIFSIESEKTYGGQKFIKAIFEPKEMEAPKYMRHSLGRKYI